jgi:hypothetical protein
MNIYVDIDETICDYEIGSESNYPEARPIDINIDKINKLYDEGHTITYWSARGSKTGKDWFELTKNQIEEWGCKYHYLSVGEKPAYDLLICDKSRRIEEI